MKLKDSNPILPSHSPLLHTITRASPSHRCAVLSAAYHRPSSSSSQHTLLSLPPYHPTVSF